MSARRLSRVVAPFVMAVTAAVLVAPRDAEAQFSSDGPLLLQMIAYEEQAVSNLQSMITILRNQTTLVQTLLSGADPSELGSALGLISGTQANYRALIGTTSALGYSIATISHAYEKTYPDTPGLTTTPANRFDTLRANQQTEILAASENASRAQATIAQTEQQTETANSILSASGQYPGEVAQLQLVVQMLAVMQSQMTMLVQNLTLTGRALTNTSAASASSEQMSRQRRQRDRLNYTRRGNPVSVPNHLP